MLIVATPMHKPWAGQAFPSRILCLPIYNELGDEDVDRVCDVIRSFYGVR